MYLNINIVKIISGDILSYTLSYHIISQQSSLCGVVVNELDCDLALCKLKLLRTLLD